MEGVGARTGRSSTRYGGPATVFTGPVRKWKKKWVDVPNPNPNTHHHSNAANGTNASHLVLYKWTPLSAANGGSETAGKEAAEPAEEAPRRKFRYVPVAVFDEQKEDASVKAEDESKSNDAGSSPNTNDENLEGKLETDDVAMTEAEASHKDRAASKPGSGTNLDLNLGLKSHDGKHESDLNTMGPPGGDVEMKLTD